MAAASPRCWGRGRCLLSPLLSCEAFAAAILGWRAGGPGALPAAQNGGGAARARGPGSRLAGAWGAGERKARSAGLPPGVQVKKGSHYRPERIDSSVSWGLLGRGELI